MVDAFHSYLLPGERIAWSGQAGGGVVFTGMDVFLIPFSLIWCAIAFPIIFFVPATAPGGPPPLLFGALFGVVGLYMVAGRFIVDWWLRRSLYYAVTDQRILILRTAPFRKFTALNLARLSDISFSERASGRGTIRFGPQPSFWMNRWGAWGGLSPSLDPTPQFLAIDDAGRVFDLVQRGAQKAATPSSA